LKIDSKTHFEIKVIESFKGVLNGKVYAGIYNQLCGPIINKVVVVDLQRKSENLIQIRAWNNFEVKKNPENNISVTRVPDPPPLNQTKSQNKKVQSNWKLELN
jgi:hypothetical protein